MFKNKIMKVLALLMVLNILIIPLTSFSPSQQNKYTVHASEGIVDIRFFNAVISLLGITAAGLAYMSPSFSIPEVDMIQLKDQFAQSLESDAAKKTAWMNAQADYLAGGVAKTMGAVELAKIGINDIYIQFKDYLKNKLPIMDIKNISSNTEELIVDGYKFKLFRYPDTPYQFLYPISIPWEPYTVYQDNYNGLRSVYRSTDADRATYEGVIFLTSSFMNSNGDLLAKIDLTRRGIALYADIYTYYDKSDVIINKYFIQFLAQFGINANYAFNLTSTGINGSIDYIGENILNTTDENISVIPIIPWIDTTVPVGTIVTPAISEPYAGAVPIDVPTTAPIDPPIDEPVDPPEDTTLLGTVAAILAGITPISAILDNILANELEIADVIEVGITGVIDGIGDIASTLTEGITSSLTDIQTNIGTLLEPPSSSINWEPIKNIPAVLFSGFPFSLPYDFYKIISFMGGSAREAPVFSFTIPLSTIGQQDVTKEIDMTPFDQIAGYVRIAELIAFSIAVMLKTKSLIWG